jgi:hypothetical protein
MWPLPECGHGGMNVPAGLEERKGSEVVRFDFRAV